MAGEASPVVPVPIELPDITSFAEHDGIGVDAVLLAGLRALVSWYSGQWELTIDTVGPARDLVPLRLQARPEQDFRALAADSAAALALAARPEADGQPGRPPHFTVLFEYVQADLPPTASGYGGHDLHLLVRRGGHALLADLICNEAAFDPAATRLFAQHYRCLVEQAIRYPGTAVGAFEPLTRQERHVQLIERNSTAAHYLETTVHALIRGHAQTQPDAIALVAEADRICYRDLVARAQTRARGLVANGVRPGQLVALVLGWGGRRVEGMLAVLFAGAAYLPVEPTSPADRLAFMLTDSGTRWLVTDDVPAVRRQLPAGSRVEVLSLDELAADAGDSAGVSLPEASPDDPAYCIYTSGTTGRPKGVVITHRNVIRLIDNDRFSFDIGPRDVWTMSHSYSFDGSVWEVYCCLGRGGRLVAVEADLIRDMRRYWQLVHSEGVTVLDMTPSAFTLFSDIACADPAATSLRYLFIAGEKLRPRLTAAWSKRRPAVTVVNAYGPTENTVCATRRILTRDDIDSDVSNIGEPVPTTTVYLLDAETGERLLPDGATGEIHLGGLGVASGYLHRPELSAERFLPSPFGDGLLYRTGDLARYRPDGTIEFIGRRDSQLKLRGYRIELDEITFCLREHPAVAEAVVLLDQQAEDSLAAYLRWSGPGGEVADVRAHLARLLPDYMLPSKIRAVDHIPLTPNGKLDTAALLALPAGPGDAVRREPQTPTAHFLARMWAELLGDFTPDADASFFELGGNSLLAMRLVARVAEQLGVDVDLEEVFDHPQLQDLADRVDAMPRRNQTAQAPALVPASSTQVPASSIQESMWFAERVVTGVPLYTVPLAWHVRGRLDIAVLKRALGMVVARHEILRSRFIERRGTVVLVVDRPWAPQVDYADLSAVPEHGRRSAITARLREAERERFDPGTGQLLRIRLLDFGGEQQALQLTTHHLVWDDVSTGIFIHELEQCYAAALGRPGELPPVRAQYRDFVESQRSQDTAGGIAYWAERLRGAPAQLPFTPPAEPERHGTVPVVLRPEVSGQFDHLRSERGVSLFMVVAAAMAVMLHCWTGLSDVTFGYPVANRDDEELMDVFGPCLNMVVIRSRRDPGTTVGEVLGATREWVLDAFSRSDVPFEAIISKLAPPRRPGLTPYVDVTVNLPRLPDDELTFGDATLRLVPIDQWEQQIKFGLSLVFLRDGDGLRGVLSYRGDRFARDDVERFARSLGQLLDHFPESLDRRLDDLDLPL
jgi:amino acid adenylation domain-containing protein